MSTTPIIPTESCTGSITMEMADLIIAEVRAVGCKLDALTQKVDGNMERTAVLEVKTKPLFSDGQPGEIENLKTRVSALENWRHWVLGIAAAIGALLGAAATWLGLSKS
jgi:hypothetical protein